MGEWGNEHYNGWACYLKESKYNGVIVAIYGPTSSGKSVARDVFVQEGWDKLVSYTTRPPRPGALEERAHEYDFVSPEEFSELNDGNMLMNVNLSYAGNSYGTDKKRVKETKRGIMITDKTSIPKLKKEMEALGKRVVTVYVTAPPETLLERQAKRLKTGEYEDQQQMQMRMTELEKEIEREQKIISMADYVIMEDDIPQTIAKAKDLADRL